MTDPRWEKLWAIYHEVVDLPPDLRSEALARACGEDAGLRAELERLLAADDDDSPLDRPPAQLFELAANLEGRDIGPWRLDQELGRGGMGAVYLAHREDGAYRQQVAIKFMARHRDEDARRRFLTERALLARLDHPCIARLIDAGETPDQMPYLVMEYVDGTTCDRWCQAPSRTTRERLELFKKICEAVQFAHQNLVVHRDLKPGNVLVTQDGQPKLLDFGIARPLNEGSDGTVTRHAMTPDFASPEQVRGDQVTTVSDVYSLGVLLYVTLSGVKPYSLADAALAQVVKSICDDEPPLPSQAASGRLAERLTGDLDAIVSRAMAKRPAERYGSAQELADDISRHLNDLPVTARRPSRMYRLGRFVRRHRLGVTAGVTAALALIVLSGSLFFQGRQLSAALVQSEAQTRRSNAAFEFLADLLLQADPETSQGNPLTVAQVLDQGAQRLVTRFEDEPLLKSELAQTVGQVYLHLGELSAAEEFFQQALAVDPESPAALAGMALVQDGRGDPAAGEQLQRQVIEILSETGDSGALAEARLRLAALLQAQSKLGAAEEEMTAALATPRVDPLAAARARIRLGSLRWAQGDIAESAQQYREALATFRDQLGDQHHETARARFALASALHRQGEYALAETNYRQSLVTREGIYGPDHPLVARVLEGLGGLLYDAGRAEESLPVSRRALAIQQALHGEEAPRTALALNNLALAEHDLGRFALAMDHYQQALSINRTTYGPRHARVAANQNNVGLIHLDLGEPEAALQPFGEALTIHQEILPDDHPALAYSAHFLGRSYLQLGQLSEAEGWLEEAVTRRARLRNGEHPQLADSLIWRSVLRMKLGRTMMALKDAERALAIRQENLESGDWRLAEATLTAAAIAWQANTPDGEAVKRAITQLNESRGPDDWRVVEITRRLAGVLCAASRGPADGNAAHPICGVE
ncbi:MAG: tetratricopeptide repeat protein [Pseudomonadota bacterium]